MHLKVHDNSICNSQDVKNNLSVHQQMTDLRYFILYMYIQWNTAQPLKRVKHCQL